jgi:hypothetical protein
MLLVKPWWGVTAGCIRVLLACLLCWHLVDWLVHSCHAGGGRERLQVVVKQCLVVFHMDDFTYVSYLKTALLASFWMPSNIG